MPRALLPGRWNRNGRAVPDPQASEIDNVIPLRAEFPAPRREPIDETLCRARRVDRALVIAVLAVLAFLIVITVRNHS